VCGTRLLPLKTCPSIPHPANRTPAYHRYRHNIASQSWWPTFWTIWDYFRSPPWLCAGSSFLLYCSRLYSIQLYRYHGPFHGHHSRLLEIHGPRLCWWCRAIFLRPSKWPHILSNFDEAAHTMGLNTSWSQTKIQNLGHGVTRAPVQLQIHKVTDRFTYLGSDIHSSERSTPEILRRIGLASNIFGRLANVRKRTGLSLQAKIRLYNALVISVLLYGSETWTILKADERRLEAFNINCQWRVLGIRWFHFVTNASVTSETAGEEGLAIRICWRRLSIFGHVGRLPEATPAHSALRMAVDTRAGGKPDIRPE